MRVRVTERHGEFPPDLRPSGELAPSLALPWIVKLRYGVLAGELALIAIAHFAFDVTLPIGWLAVPLSLMAASNLWLGRFAERFGPRPALGYVLAFDILCLTAVLALTGGPANPFSLLYLVQITLSAVVLSRAWTWALGGLSAVSFAFLFWKHARIAVFEAHHVAEGFSIHLVGMWIAFAAAALLVTIFIGKVSEALRKREQEVLRLQDQLARHQRLASVATLAAGAAHELGTPLATIALASKDLEFYSAELLKDRQVAEDACLIRAEVERCRCILQQMSARGAEPPGESPARLELGELLESVKGALPPLEQQRVRISVAGSGEPAILPAEATRQVLTALVKNALEASPSHDPVLLSAERAGDSVGFQVADRGCGMNAETLNRITEPFFTTKPPGSGMGLGTFLARAYAERLGGTLEFDSDVGKGTTAMLRFPVLP